MRPNLRKLEHSYVWLLIINSVIGLVSLLFPLLLSLRAGEPLNELLLIALIGFSLPIYGLMIGVFCLRAQRWALIASLLFYFVQIIGVMHYSSGYPATLQSGAYQYSAYGLALQSGLTFKISFGPNEDGWAWSVNVLAIVFFIFGVFLVSRTRQAARRKYTTS